MTAVGRRSAGETEDSRQRVECVPVEIGAGLGEYGGTEACGFDATNHVGSSEEVDLVAPCFEDTSDPEARRQVAAAVPTCPHDSCHCSVLLAEESAADEALDD